MNPGMKLLRELGIKLAAEAITREALIRELKNAAETETDDLEGDRPVTKVSFHSSLTVFNEELTVFLGYNNQQLMADLANWYDCRDQWTYRTKNMGTDSITGVFVNLMGATTPELIQSSLPVDAVGGGLASRIVFVYAGKRGKLVRFPFPTEEEKRLDLHLSSDLEIIHGLKGEYTLSKAAMDWWGDWYPKNDLSGLIEDGQTRFGGYVSRRPTQLQKLAMIFTAARGDSLVIEPDVFERGLEMLEQTEVDMPRVFAGFGKSKDSEVFGAIEGTIERAKSIPLSKLLKLFRLDADPRQVDYTLETLTRMGAIKMMATKTGTNIEWKGTK